MDMLKKKPDDTAPLCHGDDCGNPMFLSADVWLCAACDMVTPEEIALRKQ